MENKQICVQLSASLLLMGIDDILENCQSYSFMLNIPKRQEKRQVVYSYVRIELKECGADPIVFF